MIALHDRIVAKKYEYEQKSQGGILLVQSEQDTNRDTIYGKVISVGGGKQLDSNGKIPMTVKTGDIIVFNERIPLKFPHRGEEYLILRESDVLLILQEEDLK